MIRKTIFLACMVLLEFQAGFCQSEQYRFSKLDPNLGISHDRIKCFFKDSKGFLWIGTVSGLNRYDGYSLKVFRNDPRDSTSVITDDINKLFEDPDGRMWISTWSGMDIYDPRTETFRHSPDSMLRALGIPDRNLRDIQKDNDGIFWFTHGTHGIFKYDPLSKKIDRINYTEHDSSSLYSNMISGIQEGIDKHFWVLYRDGVIEKLDRNSLKVVYRSDALFKYNDGKFLDYRFIVDSDNDLWIYIADTNRGIFSFQPKANKLQHIHRNAKPIALNNDIVRGVLSDEKNRIWIATDHGGINLIQKNDNTIQYILHSEDDEQSLIENSINTLYKDDEGIIWAGSFKEGVSYYHESIIRFPLYKNNPDDPDSLPFDDVNCFAEDEKGNIWIGTNGGGLIYFNRSNNTFRQYLNEPNNPNSLSNNVIVSLCYDHDHKLWIGTYFGGLNCFDGRKFIRYRHDPNDSTSISDDSSWEIYEDSKNQLWVGSLTSGVDVFDEYRKKIVNYGTSNTNTLHANYIPAFLEDSEGNMWIGTGYGIEVLNLKTGVFTHYLSEPDNEKSLTNNSILSIIEDSRGMIWVGTHGGLNLFNKKSKTFRAITAKDGLPHNSIFTVVEDANKNIWLGTPNGLSNVVIKISENDSLEFTIHNYDESDGLQKKQFNENGALRTRKNEMVFGGASGFNIFNPNKIRINEKKPKIVLTDFQILNKTVDIGETVNGRKILSKSISFTDAITLKHKDNVFSFEFAALSFFHPERSQYKYRLKGFDKSWVLVNADQRKITYTNLDPGEYTFQVKASNNDGVWNEEGLEVDLTVLPPFWRTRIAMVIYILLILGALLVTRSLIQQRERLKFSIEQERQEVQRMHELDMMKIRFFTNVSHEFRTPLTLILTPIERLLSKTTDPVQATQFQLIQRNAKRLLNLVNQLLDFRKIEVQEVKFNPSEGDIISFVKETVFSFSDLSEKKNIKLEFSTPIPHLETIFDQDKLEKILFNLLSNAFKFTPEQGLVKVGLEMVQKDNEQWLQIKVADTGIGIPEDKREKVFERFFQSDLPRSMVNQGSGIGLSITKEFVKTHRGTITLESEVGKGSCFTVMLPVKDVGIHPEDIQLDLVSSNAHNELHELNGDSKTAKVPTLLLVEDNEDFRFYLKDNLSLQYHVVEARNGKEGLKTALSVLPDLIVSDVMMPEMNGVEFCRNVKTDARISHVPVILLTARSAEEQKLEGFESGADDYITKPFNFEILQSRIKNLIHQRELFHKEQKQKIDVKASTLAITSLDEKLIENAIKCVELNIGEADFSVEDLSHELGMSRVHLYKKLQALTGKSPLEFIRSIRLQHAAQLLEKSQLTVSEVAYKVGFNNPKYFAKYFKEQFSVLPSAYASGKRKS
ncbi:MAG TPA: two-component regulator propeller domain-containing protein [Ohtaekwangia sp.]|nr:two-component regulator propeller domain-containing protein [Ohtaekwangia sp.]